MKIKREDVETIKNEIANEEDCVLFEIVEKGSSLQKIALAETGKYLEELSTDEDADVRISAVLNGANPLDMLNDKDPEVRFAVVRALDSILKEQHIVIFQTFDECGKSTYFVFPSKARRAVEELTKDENTKVKNLAISVLCWQQAREHYKRFGKDTGVDEDLYVRKAHRKLLQKRIEPVPTCLELGMLEKFV